MECLSTYVLHAIAGDCIIFCRVLQEMMALMEHLVAGVLMVLKETRYHTYLIDVLIFTLCLCCRELWGQWENRGILDQLDRKESL